MLTNIEIEHLQNNPNPLPGNPIWEKAFKLYNDSNEKELYSTISTNYIMVLLWILKNNTCSA